VSRRGLTLIEMVVAIGILISAMLVAFTVFLQSNATAALSSELALAEHGAERMLDLIRADGGGVIDFSDHYTVYGGSARLPFGFDTAAPNDSVLHPAPFGWADPISGRPRLRDPIGWLFVAVDADERVSPPVPTQVVAETLFAGNGPFGASVAGVDLNGDLDQDDDNAGLLNGVGSSYTGALLPVTIIVEWVSGDGGFPTRRTFKLRTVVPRED
jgi:type II secretory pathway pseudopilin PulG